MTEKYFVDTNLLVYARDAAVREKQRRASEWLDYLWRNLNGRVSFQVLQEFYVTVTRKLKPGMDEPSAQKAVRRFLVWDPAVIDARVLEQAWTIQARYGLSFWDALVIGTALLQDCDRVLTEDLQDGQDFEGLLVANPFTHQPGSLE